MVRDALATCRVELWSATHWPPLFPQAHRRSCAAEGPAQRGHLLTGVGARKQAVGNTTVATPGSVSRLDTAGVQNKGAGPRTAQETGLEKLCSCLRFSAAPCVAFCVLCRWFCFPVRFCCPCLPFCAGCCGFYCACLSSPLFHGHRPKNRALRQVHPIGRVPERYVSLLGLYWVQFISLYPFVTALSNPWVSSARVIGSRQTFTCRERLDEGSDQVGASRTASVLDQRPDQVRALSTGASRQVIRSSHGFMYRARLDE